MALQVKVFGGITITALETDINKWLKNSADKNYKIIDILQSQDPGQTATVGGKTQTFAPHVAISIWYDDESIKGLIWKPR